MSFVWPAMLWLLLLVPLGIFGLRALERRRARTAQAYADAHLLPRVLQRPPARLERWPLALQLGALALLLFTAARPVAAVPLPVNKAAVLVAIDVSRSMLADDLKPSRLEAAKEATRELVRRAPGSTRIGLSTFSDGAAVLVPPTTDRAQLLEALERVKPAQSTSLASAVVAGVRALPERKGAQPPRELRGPGAPAADPNAKPIDTATLPPGAILILSDGVSNRGPDPRLAAKFASDHKVKLFTVALGKQGGAVTQIDGQTVFVPFEPGALESLAQLTDGKYVNPPEPEAMRAVFRELGSVVRWEPTRLELGGALSGLAAALLVAAGGLALRWHRRVP